MRARRSVLYVIQRFSIVTSPLERPPQSIRPPATSDARSWKLRTARDKESLRRSKRAKGDGGGGASGAAAGAAGAGGGVAGGAVSGGIGGDDSGVTCHGISSEERWGGGCGAGGSSSGTKTGAVGLFVDTVLRGGGGGGAGGGGGSGCGAGAGSSSAL